MKTFKGVWFRHPHDDDAIMIDLDLSAIPNGLASINGLSQQHVVLDKTTVIGKVLPGLLRMLRVEELSPEFMATVGISKESVLEKFVIVLNDTITVVYANSKERAMDTYVRVMQSHLSLSRGEVYEA